MKPAHRSAMPRGLFRPASALIVVALLMAALVAGCSSDSKPSYCKAADQLKTSTQNLSNVNVRTNGLSSLKTALSTVQSDAKTFADEAKSAFAPQITALQDALSGLSTAIKSVVGQPSVAAITQIGSSVTQVKDSAGNLVSAVSNKCK